MATSSNQDNKDENELHRLKKNTQDQLCRLVQEVRIFFMLDKWQHATFFDSSLN